MFNDGPADQARRAQATCECERGIIGWRQRSTGTVKKRGAVTCTSFTFTDLVVPCMATVCQPWKQAVSASTTKFSIKAKALALIEN
jgi:hypothetical protein